MLPKQLFLLVRSLTGHPDAGASTSRSQALESVPHAPELESLEIQYVDQEQGVNELSQERIKALGAANPVLGVYLDMYQRGSDFEIASAEAPHFALGEVKKLTLKDADDVPRDSWPPAESV